MCLERITTARHDGAAWHQIQPAFRGADMGGAERDRERRCQPLARWLRIDQRAAHDWLDWQLKGRADHAAVFVAGDLIGYSGWTAKARNVERRSAEATPTLRR